MMDRETCSGLEDKERMGSKGRASWKRIFGKKRVEELSTKTKKAICEERFQSVEEGSEVFSKAV